MNLNQSHELPGPYRARHPQPRSGRGQKSMIWAVGAGLIALTLWNHVTATAERGPLWRVFAAIAVFLYLWWLAALLFDLLFVWHRYIQKDAAMNFLRENVQREHLSAGDDNSPDDRPSGGATADVPPAAPSGVPTLLTLTIELPADGGPALARLQTTPAAASAPEPALTGLTPDDIDDLLRPAEETWGAPATAVKPQPEPPRSRPAAPAAEPRRREAQAGEDMNVSM